MSKADIFWNVFEYHLLELSREGLTTYPVSEVSSVAKRFRNAWDENPYSVAINGKAFTQTCKEMKIKKTIQSIADWMKS